MVMQERHGIAPGGCDSRMIAGHGTGCPIRGELDEAFLGRGSVGAVQTGRISLAI
jgi:hypothetical protein